MNPFAKHTSSLFASKGCDLDAAMMYARELLDNINPEDRAAATTALMVVINTASTAWTQSQSPSPAQEVAAAWVRDLVAKEVDRHAAGLQDKVDDIIKEWIGANLDIEEKMDEWAQNSLTFEDSCDSRIERWIENNLDVSSQVEDYLNDNLNLEDKINDLDLVVRVR